MNLLITDIGFPEADYPWLPTLLDIEIRKSEGKPGYANIGFDSLVLDDQEHPRLASAWTRLNMRFNGRYANRMLNSETLERWQIRLQNRLDEIVDEYERAYRLYEEYADDMDELHEGYENTTGQTDLNSGTDVHKTTLSRRTADTPDSNINESDAYAHSVSKVNDELRTTYGKHVVKSGSLTHVQTGVRLQMNVVKSFKSWVDLDTSFISEFENLFLNVFWY